ncbi:hypothetical protein AB205_0218770 [Aquarana catesbeiana]|uniref:Uncharacterized protein n=1 Tax=Aquarana catesbeiana TaxID=8400 RepID=A0A2G9P372_AQUCT|nr:hypothetical protein AB205_0218770 [Aquarana catesbeiana]
MPDTEYLSHLMRSGRASACDPITEPKTEPRKEGQTPPQGNTSHGMKTVIPKVTETPLPGTGWRMEKMTGLTSLSSLPGHILNEIRAKERRFLSSKYAFYTGSVKTYETDWSPPITTNRGQDPGSIDLWPGGRSGGMIVITSILSVLTFFVLAGLLAAVITNLM